MSATVIPFRRTEPPARITIRRDGGVWCAFDGRGWTYVSHAVARELNKLAAVIVAETNHAR